MEPGFKHTLSDYITYTFNKLRRLLVTTDLAGLKPTI